MLDSILKSKGYKTTIRANGSKVISRPKAPQAKCARVADPVGNKPGVFALSDALYYCCSHFQDINAQTRLVIVQNIVDITSDLNHLMQWQKHSQILISKKKAHWFI